MFQSNAVLWGDDFPDVYQLSRLEGKQLNKLSLAKYLYQAPKDAQPATSNVSMCGMVAHTVRWLTMDINVHGSL